MLQTQLVPISFIGGIDTKTDQKAVSTTKLTGLENGVFTKGHKITKRNGYDKKTAASGAPQGLFAYKNELLKFDNYKVYSYDGANDSLLDKGSVYSIETNVDNVTASDVDVSLTDMMLTDKYEIYVYQNSWLTSGFTINSSKLYVSVIDRETRAIIVNRKEIGTYRHPRLVTNGADVFLVVLAGGATPYVSTCKFEQGSDPFPTANFLTMTDSGSSTIYADKFVVQTARGTPLICWGKDSSEEIGVFYLDITGAAGKISTGYPNPVKFTAVGDIKTISLMVDDSDNSFYVFYDNQVATDYFVRAKKYNVNFTVAVADTQIIDVTLIGGSVRRLVPIQFGTNIAVLVEYGGATNNLSFIYSDIAYILTTTSLAVSTGYSFMHSTSAMITDVISYNSKKYGIIGNNNFGQASYYLTEFVLENLTLKSIVVSKSLPDQAGIVWSYNKSDMSVPGYRTSLYVDDSVIYFSGLKALNSVTVTDVSPVQRYVHGVASIRFDMDANNNFYCRRLGENLFISGGVVSEYDGVSAYEAGFHLYPISSGNTLNQAGGSLSAGEYLYYIMFEWVDNNGQLHRSNPYMVSVVNTAGQKNDFGIYTLTLTKKSELFGRDNVKVAFYRTIANGTTAYKIGEVENDPTTDQITYSDTAADSAIQTNQQYIPSVLTNGPIQSAKVVEVYRDRLFLAGLENPLEVRFSKSFTPGYQIGFPSEFTFRVNPLGGDIKGLKFMDDKLIIFKENLIFVLAGDGPNDLGQGQQYTGAELLSTDVGCPYPNSIVLTPMGVMFKSHKGIYLISRNLQVSYIGAEVEAYNNLTIQSGDLIQDKNQVRFLHKDGVCLMYDYYFSQWSTFTNHEGIDADIWQGNYTYLRSDGEVYVENSTKYRDDNESYSLKIVTAWIKLQGLQGFQRVKRASVIGNLEASHVLKIGIGYDYSQNFDSLFYFDPSAVLGQNPYGTGIYGELTPYGGSADNLYQFRMHVPKQKCESIRFSFEDMSGGDPTIGYSLNELMLDVGIKKGGFKLPASKSL